MPFWSRIRNVWRGDRLSREIDEELEAHLAEAVERGRDPGDVRRAFGSQLRHREQSRDIRLLSWLDSLRSDAVFGWRQLKKRKATSAAAVLSLGLAIGSCAAAFRLVDALLWRPLPVANPSRLHLIGRNGIDPGGTYRFGESSEYPLFERFRATAKGEAELIAISYADRPDVTYGSDEEMEKVSRQYVSGVMFGVFGLRPAAGRLLTAEDDRTPGAHPVTVISYDYWSRRFGRDPNAVGRKARIGNDLFEVVGVCERGFTGAEPGSFVDVFVPAMMHPGVTRADWSWFRTFAMLKPGAAPEPLAAKLRPTFAAFQRERAGGWTNQSKQFIDRFLDQTLVLEPAPSGASGMQRDYKRSLIVIGVLVSLVLLIACANLANLMTAQAAARARELALRVSIGAGRWRLVQLVMVESVWAGALSAAIGTLFAAWAAPAVVNRISRPDVPIRLDLPADWRVLAFTVAVALTATFLFGLAPALRASAVKPASALKGGADPHRRRRLMHALIAAQVAFCFVVHFAAGLFVSSFERLANRPTGFDPNRLLLLDTVARRPQGPPAWEQTLEQLRAFPGVESAAMSGWPQLDGNGWNGFIWVNNASTEVLSYFLGVTPEYLDTMRIPKLQGRGLRPGEIYPSVAVVNTAFARQVFGGADPMGRYFEKESGDGVTRDRFQVVGVVGDSRYRSLREPATPIAYVPLFQAASRAGFIRPRPSASFIVRTSGPNPLALAEALRKEVSRAGPELRVSKVRTQTQLVEQQTVRERLLSTLALFFAAVALLLAGIGLYGVLIYSVEQRRREIGIRIAIGAPVRDVARRVIAGALWMVAVGSVVGAGLGLALSKSVGTLLYEVKPTDTPMLTAPGLTLVIATILAALPAVIRAACIDPAAMLRSE
jgi:predicted permease